MYDVFDIKLVVGCNNERDNPHPIYDAFIQGRIGKNFSPHKVRDTVVPANMELIKQYNEHIGDLLTYLKDTDASQETMVILTSDHGEYLGNHSMGEKDLLNATSVKVLLIIHYLSKNTYSTRRNLCNALVRAIHVTATIVDASSGVVPEYIVEGRTLLFYFKVHLIDQPRSFAISEYDYFKHPVCSALGISPRDARLFMVATIEWKLIHAEGDFPPMLFDLANDTDELCDRGRDPAYVKKRI